ncbi:pyridoxamine 5'-phosphate oxidase family protein [uncultured Campylobacter sp.]|uniref:pyridoxamine 5'-phosphate oxidase family protein n=1 Tax=uncultured Campylobacter sp. TaxID=218934 RepID=UPI00260B6C31|nr:pyridoxamine 5'-phosphate oxidase family protein [uncultured Campylobacter sp.]
MDEKILKFIRKMHLLSLAVLDEGKPYCASCFYAFDEGNLAFIVAGSEESAHVKAFLAEPCVAGTVALDTKVVGKIEGVQFRALAAPATAQQRKIYFARFPYALAMNPSLYALSLGWVKFTHNALGFGRKIVWQRD